MLASALVLGVAAGWLSGRNLSRLGELRIRLWWLLGVGLLLRLAAPIADQLAWILYVVAFSAIVAVALADRRLAGMLLIAAGAGLNALVVALNAGMPVDQGAVAIAGAQMPEDHLHLVLTPESRLPFLADVIPFRLFENVYSVGDVLLAAGGFWLPFAWMRRR